MIPRLNESQLWRSQKFDPPKDPTFFVHRAGRTARAGNVGVNILILTILEEDNGYIEFIKKNQKIGEMDQFKPKFEQLEIEKLRKVQTMDKRNFEFAQKAFPSFVAAYKVRSSKMLRKSQFCTLTPTFFAKFVKTNLHPPTPWRNGPWRNAPRLIGSEFDLLWKRPLMNAPQ